ncbi:hypothetical protein M8494_03690 [Serratia ureilytica]
MEFDRSDLRCRPPRDTLASPWGGSICAGPIKSGELIIPFTDMTVPCEHCYFTDHLRAAVAENPRV